MRMLSAALAALWLLAALPAAAQSPTPYGELPGTAWTMVEWSGEAPKTPPIPRLAFDRDYGFSGMAGCNGFGGRYQVVGTQIRFYPTYWTKRLCREDRMRLDGKVSADLKRVWRLALGGDGILLAHAEDGAVIFRFRRAGPGEKD